jgi:uncharacterized protein YndB with AHSA1/START domain
MESTKLARIAAGMLLAACTTAIHASTNMPTASSYLVTHKVDLDAPPAAVFAALGQIDRWWSGDHTYSGKASNLKIEMRGGGCFCENWEGGSVEHARVINVLKDRLLRLEGALGPLQDRAATAVLSFVLTTPEQPNRTHLLVTYRVRAVEGAIESSAEGVDRVIGEQVKRLAEYVGRK